MDRCGLARNFQEAQDVTVAVLSLLPSHQYHIGLIHTEEFALHGVERPRRINCPVLILDFVSFERSQSIPTQPRKGRRIDSAVTGYDIPEGEIPALAGHVVRVPVVVHHIRENRSPALAELRGPGPPGDVAQCYERGIDGHDCRGQPVLLRRHPLLHGKPLAAASRQDIRGGVDVTILNRIAEFRVVHGKREGEVDTLLRVHLVLSDVVDDLDPLLISGKDDFGLDARRIDAGTLQPRNIFEGQLGYGEDFPVAGAVRGELGERRDVAEINQAVRALVGSGDVHILVEAIRTAGVDEFPL